MVAGAHAGCKRVRIFQDLFFFLTKHLNNKATSQATVTVRRGRLLLWNHSKVAHVDMLSYSLIKNQVQNSFVANKVSRLLRDTQKRFPKEYIENTF